MSCSDVVLSSSYITKGQGGRGWWGGRIIPLTPCIIQVHTHKWEGMLKQWNFACWLVVSFPKEKLHTLDCFFSWPFMFSVLGNVQSIAKLMRKPLAPEIKWKRSPWNWRKNDRDHHFHDILSWINEALKSFTFKLRTETYCPWLHDLALLQGSTQTILY